MSDLSAVNIPKGYYVSHKQTLVLAGPVKTFTFFNEAKKLCTEKGENWEIVFADNAKDWREVDQETGAIGAYTS